MQLFHNVQGNCFTNVFQLLVTCAHAQSTTTPPTRFKSQDREQTRVATSLTRTDVLQESLPGPRGATLQE